MVELQNIEIFYGLCNEDLMLLQQHMTVRAYSKNTIILNEGDDASSLYVILSGSAKVFLSNDEGKEIILNTLHAGDHFGELALLDNSPRSASIITSEKSKMGIISKIDFKHVLTNHPHIALHLISHLTKRVRLLSDTIRNLALLDVYGRVAKTLLDLATDKDGLLIIENRPTQQELANRIGASREMVAKIMKDLSIGGYITVDSKIISINEKLPAGY
jgi:CRP/FNR family cyclic AMP-dependent transcriptional regulator